MAEENVNMFEGAVWGTPFLAKNGEIVRYSGKPYYVELSNLRGSYCCKENGEVDNSRTPYTYSEWDLVKRLD